MARKKNEKRKRRPNGLVVAPPHAVQQHGHAAWGQAAAAAAARDLSGHKVLTCALLLRGTAAVLNLVVHRGREVIGHRQMPEGSTQAAVELMEYHGCTRLYFVIASVGTRTQADHYWLVDPADEAVYRSTDLTRWERATSPEHWDNLAVMDEVVVGHS